MTRPPGGLALFLLRKPKRFHFDSILSLTAKKRTTYLGGSTGLEYVVFLGWNMWLLTQAQIKFSARAFSIACTRLLTASLP